MLSCIGLFYRWPGAVIVIRVPLSAEQMVLIRHGYTLEVVHIPECVRLIRSAPVAAPYHAVIPGQTAEKTPVPVPGSFAVNNFAEVAGKAVTMHAHVLQLRGFLFKKILLTGGGTKSLGDEEGNTQGPGTFDYGCDRRSGCG